MNAMLISIKDYMLVNVLLYSSFDHDYISRKTFRRAVCRIGYKFILKYFSTKLRFDRESFIFLN